MQSASIDELDGKIVVEKSVLGSDTGGEYVMGMSVSPYARAVVFPNIALLNGGPPGSMETIECTRSDRWSASSHAMIPPCE